MYAEVAQPPQRPADTEVVARHCLDRLTLLSVAAERCPPATLRRVRQHLPECTRCRARLVRAAEGHLGDTVDDEPQRLSRRPLAITLGAGLIAIIAFAASRWEPDTLHTAEAPVLDPPLPVATTSTPSTEAALTEPALTGPAHTEPAALETTPAGVIVSDARKLDPDVPCDVSPRAALSPARPEQGRPHAAPAIEPPAPVAEAPEDDLARARVGVLVDGRRVRLTLD